MPVGICGRCRVIGGVELVSAAAPSPVCRALGRLLRRELQRHAATVCVDPVARGYFALFGVLLRFARLLGLRSRGSPRGLSSRRAASISVFSISVPSGSVPSGSVPSARVPSGSFPRSPRSCPRSRLPSIVPSARVRLRFRRPTPSRRLQPAAARRRHGLAPATAWRRMDRLRCPRAGLVRWPTTTPPEPAPDGRGGQRDLGRQSEIGEEIVDAREDRRDQLEEERDRVEDRDEPGPMGSPNGMSRL